MSLIVYLFEDEERLIYPSLFPPDSSEVKAFAAESGKKLKLVSEFPAPPMLQNVLERSYAASKVCFESDPALLDLNCSASYAAGWNRIASGSSVPTLTIGEAKEGKPERVCDPSPRFFSARRLKLRHAFTDGKSMDALCFRKEMLMFVAGGYMDAAAILATQEGA